MEEEFTTYATAKIMVDNISYESAEKLSDKLADLNGVKSVAFDDTDKHYNESSALFTLTFEGDEDDEESGSVVPAPMTRPTAPAVPAPQKNAKAQTKRRRKAIMALRALHRKIGD